MDITSQQLAKLSTLFGGSPLMTMQAFAERSGMSYEAVKKAVQRGELPVVQIGARRKLINVIRLAALCLEGDFVVVDAEPSGSSVRPVSPSTGPNVPLSPSGAPAASQVASRRSPPSRRSGSKAAKRRKKLH